MIRSSDPILIALIENATSATMFGRTSFKQEKAERNETNLLLLLSFYVTVSCLANVMKNQQDVIRRRREQKTSRRSVSFQNIKIKNKTEMNIVCGRIFGCGWGKGNFNRYFR